MLFRGGPAVLLEQPRGDSRGWDHPDAVAQAAPPIVELEGGIGSLDLRLVCQNHKIIVGVSHERALVGPGGYPPSGGLEPSDDLLSG